MIYSAFKAASGAYRGLILSDRLGSALLRLHPNKVSPTPHPHHHHWASGVWGRQKTPTYLSLHSIFDTFVSISIFKQGYSIIHGAVAGGGG